LVAVLIAKFAARAAFRSFFDEMHI
jgi:hypothetical protein